MEAEEKEAGDNKETENEEYKGIGEAGGEKTNRKKGKQQKALGRNSEKESQNKKSNIEWKNIRKYQR